ncbi:hypothetical protein CYMTET_21071 [Cymbomonas tetramitiformis]|uniref:Protein kinase domain-containing protein n=1 Tax=Cymbomonas tetramitiformis TaxID=36881 RepID=A0AAE0G2W4_9CHLO|nr:hypothetical protein CYMTET_21071 [Cymbomonas tetramitiformis]
MDEGAGAEGGHVDALKSCLQICVRIKDDTDDLPPSIKMASNPTFSIGGPAPCADDQHPEDDEAPVQAIAMSDEAGGSSSQQRSALLLLQAGPTTESGDAEGESGEPARCVGDATRDRSGDVDEVTAGAGGGAGAVGRSPRRGGGGCGEEDAVSAPAARLCDYSVAQVREWVERLGIPGFAFEEEEVAGALLCGLSQEELQSDLGLSSAHAETLTRALEEQLREEERRETGGAEGAAGSAAGISSSVGGNTPAPAADFQCGMGPARQVASRESSVRDSIGLLVGEQMSDEEGQALGEGSEKEEEDESARRLRHAAIEQLGESGAVARALSHEVGSVMAELSHAERIAAVVKLLQAARAPLRGRYELERSVGHRKGASGVVGFAQDCENGTRVAVKVFLDMEDFHAERANCRRCISPHVVKVLDAHPAPAPSAPAGLASGAAAPEEEGPDEALLRYGHLVMERGEHSLAEFLQRRPSLNAVRKLAIMHDVFAALRFMHDDVGMVHGDMKPANVVKFAAEDVWKLVDMATASPVGEEARVEYTLRYAAPEVVRGALAGSGEVAAREPAADMWSAGVMMFELYTGRRLFGDDVGDEEVLRQLIGGGTENELVLKGLAGCEAGAARLIRDKLLVMDPRERWPAEKVLSSSFFKRMEDTTRIAHSSRELGKDMRRLSVMVEETKQLAAVSVSEMQAGGLMVEVNLTETSPKQQSCILSEHDRAGPVFNLVLQCQYHLELTVFREVGAMLRNPVKAVLGAVIITADGNPLPLGLLPAPPTPTTISAAPPRLPNALAFVGAWAPSMCQSALLVTKTKWPETRRVTLELQLELHDLPGRPVTIRHELNFLMHKKDGAKLRALRKYEWAKQEYLNMTPETRTAIRGMVFAVQTGAGLVL